MAREGAPAPPGPLAAAGLTGEEAARRLAAQGGARERPSSSRSTASIVRANTLTPFNAILVALGLLTLVYGDWRDALFLGVVVSNTGIGIWQELTAKRKLDSLAALVAPHATVVRDDVPRPVAVGELVVGDLVRVAPGDQIVADGTLAAGVALMLDESILTGESGPVERAAGEEVRSGTFVAEGTGAYVVTAVGEDSYAERITGEARAFRHPRSPLERSLNRLLYALVAVMVPVGGLFVVALARRDVDLSDAVTEAVAGIVTLVPEGLVLLASLTFAAAAVRMARQGALAQQLNAIESLASVDVLLTDKTGTLTSSSLTVHAVVPAEGVDVEQLRRALGRFAASSEARNATLQAILDAYPAEPVTPSETVPFASRRRWSALTLAGERLVLGAPELFALEALAEVASSAQAEGRRVVAIGVATSTLPTEPDAGPPPTRLLGVAILAEELRPGASETVAYLLAEGVELRVLSGDAPATVASIARDVGIPMTAPPLAEDELPESDGELRTLLRDVTVVGRISPEGKRRVARALAAGGRYVAMVGDGVNDVPALKEARLAIAQGSGTHMAKAVADVVLVGGDFGVVPPMIHQGRQILRNVQRVAKLFVAKSVLAVFLILSVGISTEQYPLLPRHMTLAASLTIGIPAFFLALAPSSGPWATDRFLREVARFSVPAGVAAGQGVLVAYLASRNVFDAPLEHSRTVACIVLVLVGLYLVVVLEATGGFRSVWVGGLVTALLGAFVAVLVLPGPRAFFALEVPTAGDLACVLLGTVVAIAFLLLIDERFQPGRVDRPARSRGRA